MKRGIPFYEYCFKTFAEIFICDHIYLLCICINLVYNKELQWVSRARALCFISLTLYRDGKIRNIFFCSKTDKNLLRLTKSARICFPIS